MGTFSSDGYIRERLTDWQARLKAVYQSVFGTSIDLSDDTMDGQLIGTLSEALSNQDQQVELISKVCDPDQAQGTYLSTLVQINGIKRLGVTNSVVQLSITGVNGTLIPAGSIVRSNTTGSLWTTADDVTIAGGVASVSATCTEGGAVPALAGTLILIDSNIPGWSTVTNSNDATMGEDGESDTDLRIRRRLSVAVASTGNVQGLLGALLNLPGIIDAVVIENDTEVNIETSIPPHAIACVVTRDEVIATDEIVGELINRLKSAGCLTHGSTTIPIQDPNGYDKDVNFSDSTAKDIYVEITKTDLDDYPEDGDAQMKAAIVAYFNETASTKQGIGEDVIYSSLYVPIMSIPGVDVTAVTLGLSASPTGVISLEMAYNELAVFDESRIEIVTS